MIGNCEKCGVRSVLVCDIKKPSARDRFRDPSLCFDCWRAADWKQMKRWYVTGLCQLFLLLLPLMTFGLWVFYIFYWRYQPHFGDKQGFYLILLLPSMLSVGTIPQVSLYLLLVSRFGPKLERIPALFRWIVAALPPIIYGIVSVLAVLAFFYIRDGHVVMQW